MSVEAKFMWQVLGWRLQSATSVWQTYNEHAEVLETLLFAVKTLVGWEIWGLNKGVWVASGGPVEGNSNPKTSLLVPSRQVVIF